MIETLTDNLKHQIVVADPPWRFMGWSAKGDAAGRGYSRHYACMTTDEICGLPVKSVVDDDAVLLLWAIGNRLPDALRVVDAWGFSYVGVAFTWIKRSAAGQPLMGTGYWTRGNAEYVLLAKRGRGIRPAAKNIPSVIVSPRREHSRKPEELFQRVNRMFPNSRRIELFARERRDGWAAWGNEVGKLSA